MPDSKDDNQKRKTASAHGPHGIGDPNDRTLRNNEKNLLIPQRRREIVREEYCSNEIKSYEECVLNTGLFTAPFYCKSLKVKMADCLEFWNDNDQVHRRAREEYLEERSEYRRTGISRDKREFFEQYMKNTEQNESNKL